MCTALLSCLCAWFGKFRVGQYIRHLNCLPSQLLILSIGMKCGMLVNGLIWMEAGSHHNCHLMHVVIVHWSKTLFIPIRLLHVLYSVICY